MDEMGIAPDPDDDVDCRLQVPPHAVSNVRWNASSHALIKLIGQLSNAPSNTMLLVKLNVPSNFPLDDSSNVPSSVPPNWQPTITQIFDFVPSDGGQTVPSNVQLNFQLNVQSNGKQTALSNVRYTGAVDVVLPNRMFHGVFHLANSIACHQRVLFALPGLSEAYANLALNCCN